MIENQNAIKMKLNPKHTDTDTHTHTHTVYVTYILVWLKHCKKTKEKEKKRNDSKENIFWEEESFQNELERIIQIQFQLNCLIMVMKVGKKQQHFVYGFHLDRN